MHIMRIQRAAGKERRPVSEAIARECVFELQNALATYVAWKGHDVPKNQED